MRVHKVPNKGYYSRVGDFFGPLRPTAAQAQEALIRELEAYKPLDHTYLRCQDGTFIHLQQTPSHGWNLYIIPSLGYKGEGVGVQGTWRQAKDRAYEIAEERFGGVINS